jgi:hypothetical protein
MSFIQRHPPCSGSWLYRVLSANAVKANWSILSVIRQVTVLRCALYSNTQRKPHLSIDMAKKCTATSTESSAPTQRTDCAFCGLPRTIIYTLPHWNIRNFYINLHSCQYFQEQFRNCLQKQDNECESRIEKSKRVIYCGSCHTMHTRCIKPPVLPLQSLVGRNM